MRIFRGREINWRYAIGEILLIVVGILIALGIDACVSDRADRRKAAGYLDDLVAELRADSAALVERAERLQGLAAGATAVLAALESGGTDEPRLGDVLLTALFGEGITSEPVVWEQLRSTGDLRLIEDAAVRSAIVSHYLARQSRFRVVDENFVPALRALRSLAWDIIPMRGFAGFFQSEASGEPARRSGVPNAVVLEGLARRDDAEFLLKRYIVTASAAGGNLSEQIADTTELLRVLEGRPVPDSGPGAGG